MLGDMHCHTDGTPSDADTEYRTQIGIFSYEYMGSVALYRMRWKTCCW